MGDKEYLKISNFGCKLAGKGYHRPSHSCDHHHRRHHLFMSPLLKSFHFPPRFLLADADADAYADADADGVAISSLFLGLRKKNITHSA